jgi:uncharacterized protein (DUF983 family)
LFRAYLKVNDQCPVCAEHLHHQRADDAPPYVVILVLGHILVPLLVAVELAVTPPYWVYLVTCPPLILGLALWLLPHAKGMIIALQWANRMHGFGGASTND